MSRSLEIRLTGVRAYGYHGVLAEERRDGQDFVVDVTALPAHDRPCDSDDIADAVDYGAVAERIAVAITGEPVALLEHLADKLALDLLERFPLREVHVTVHKPNAPIAVKFEDVMVTVRRSA